jgi:hypothetical protein
MNFVCPGCGREDSLSQPVTVRGWRDVKIKVEKGKPKFEIGTYVNDTDSGTADEDGMVECHCGQQFRDASELRLSWDDLHPGDVVVLPDRLRGTIDRVEGPNAITVEGWHEVFAAHELLLVHHGFVLA